jgi:hypothetical protein
MLHLFAASVMFVSIEPGYEKDTSSSIQWRPPLLYLCLKKEEDKHLSSPQTQIFTLILYLWQTANNRYISGIYLCLII